ncbi:glycosyltransferase family 10 [Bacteroides sp. CR5/BHMF/2]|nr:glycosyltransferase family 10 [Bacteroides sp. CR5/BHMF/2]
MELKRLYANKIDFYGDGVNFVDDKADSILPYMFHICIENSSVPHYWTEKIADSLLGYAVPIYYGAPNILDYFPQKAIIWLDLNNTKACVQTISEILEQPEKIYNEMLPYLLEARNKLLDEYNIFPTLEKFIMEHPTSDEVKMS